MNEGIFSLLKHLLILIILVICAALMIMGFIYFLQQVKPWFTENVNYTHWIFLGVGASINTVKQTIAGVDGKVKSQYTLTTTAMSGGKKVISGFTSLNDGKTSEFIIQANKFAIVNQKDGSTKMPFVLWQNKLVLDGDLIASGTLKGESLVAGATLKAPIIKGGRVESGHFAGGSINIGNGNFNVDANGDLYAKSGRFEGTVYAEKIEGDIVKSVNQTTRYNTI
ncbi:MAG TPA: DUF1983 domain-containing protein, partial [Erysipelothrix sp.]